MKVKKIGWAMEALHIPLIAMVKKQREKCGISVGDILKVKLMGTSLMAKAVIVQGFKDVFKADENGVVINEVLAFRLGINREALVAQEHTLEVVDKEVIARPDQGRGRLGQFLDNI